MDNSHDSNKPVALQWLAEMILSDCGCSTSNQRLLERVLARIDQYERSNTPAQQSGQLAKRRIFDSIRGAYDLGYSDARNAKAVPGDKAPGYKGRNVEADHGGALLHALEAIKSPPPASKPLTPLLFSRRKAIADKLGVPMDTTFNAIVREVEAAHKITIKAAHKIGVNNG